MTREHLLLVLLLCLAGVAVPLGSFASEILKPIDQSQPGAVLEKAAFRRLCLPFIALVPLMAWLTGWAIAEPKIGEKPPVIALAFAGLVAAIVARAVARAFRALRAPEIKTAATLGIWRPKIVVAPSFAELVDEAALNAVVVHERTHVAHRDPLRILLVQIVGDLQWPLPGGARRFEQWLFFLELARDEEARQCVEGADLAAAVLSATVLEQSLTFAVAAVASAGADTKFRVERLLAPPIPMVNPRRSAFDLVVAVSVLAVCLFFGTRFGEPVVRSLLGLWR